MSSIAVIGQETDTIIVNGYNALIIASKKFKLI